MNINNYKQNKLKLKSLIDNERKKAAAEQDNIKIQLLKDIYILYNEEIKLLKINKDLNLVNKIINDEKQKPEAEQNKKILLRTLKLKRKICKIKVQVLGKINKIITKIITKNKTLYKKK